MVLRRKILVMVAAGVAAAVTLSACSSSGGGGGSASTPPSTAAGAGTTTSGGTAPTSGASSSAGAASGTPIKVGVICSCSGPFGSTIASAWKVVQAWQKSVNAAGGLNGHPVDIIEKDNGSNPGTAATDAQAMVSAKVAAILDLDILDAVWEKPVSAAKIPVIGGNFSSAMFYQDPNWFPSGQTNDSITYSVAATAKQAGATKIGQLYCSESVQCQESVPLIKKSASKFGLTDVYDSSISATAPNYTAQCLAAKQAGVDGLFIGDSISVIARVASDCDKQGYDPNYITEGTGFTDQTLTTPGLKDKLWSEFPILPYFSNAPSVAAMNTVLDKYFPGLRKDPNTWSEYAAQAWTAGLLLAQAVKNAKPAASAEVTNETITSGLNKVKNETLGGFSPKLTFTAGKAHSVDCWYLGRVQGGKAHQVGGITCKKG